MLKNLLAPGNDSMLTSFALLLLRAWLGLCMLLLHGVGKVKDFSKLSADFPDPLNVGHTASLALVVFAEVVCSVLLVLGLVTRFAALVLAVNVFVAFFIVLQGALTGPHSGEIAFIYLAGYVALLFAGAGKLSLDKMIFGKGSKAPAPK
jgi:putative oxidoreductase